MTEPSTSPRTPPPEGELPTSFVPSEVEGRLYARWVDKGWFTPAAQAPDGAEPFCVVLPPPNVTGSLHIGHALDHSLQDALVRRRRMQGYDVLWLPGTDHAGIATQNVVERQLAEKEGLSRHDLGREAFVERVWDWKSESGGAILTQMRRLGDSVDWTRERFTMDEGLSRSVQTMFKDMFDAGLIYRAERIINWCPRCLTALSDIEVEHRDDEGELVSIRYGEGTSAIVVATTRAETMLGDTAVAVHPDDERYRHLVGTEVELPLTGRRIPIVADEHVDPAFGTGAVKVTPAHDPNDFEIGRRHDLPSLMMMDERGVITAPGPFAGLDRFEARPAVVAALRAEGRIVAEKRPYVHAVGHCSRCQSVVEPRLSLQWFVAVEPLARAAGDAVREGRVRIVPAELSKRYFAWVDDMHDWCISRQLWWGHRIPVWYGPQGETVCVGPGETPPAGPGWVQDPDVLDTWFSSGLWPFSTLGWPEETPDLRRFYPTSVLVTGYDILFFWVARMMMFGLYAHRGSEQPQPFHTVYLHGMVRDAHGKKMSKSAGNVVDPLDWIDRYGADATRFTLLRGAHPGADVPTSEDWAGGSRAFVTKLWNAARFALLNGATSGELPPAESLALPDRWILSRLSQTVREADELYESYEFGKVCELLYHFAWDDLCDWYLELAKAPLSAGGTDAQRVRLVLGHVFDVLLRLLHPLTPFVTETLWTKLTGGETLVLGPWPATENRRDDAAEREMEALQRLVTEVRRFRSEQGLNPGQRVPARLDGAAGHEAPVRELARLDLPGPSFAATASLRIADVSVELDLSGTIDVAAERRRLERDFSVATKELQQVTGKLANTDFVGKAPAAVVERARERQAVAEAEIARLRAQLGALSE